MLKIKVSDYVMSFLVQKKIKDMFLISGGGMMHLLDSAKKQKKLNLIFNLNEQASGICAESYSQFTNDFGVCMVTTGPGATNAITGCAGAWTDSTPVMFISGQCKTEQMGQLKGLRIYGAQEIAIIPCVKPITKYSVTVLNKNEIAYHLEKAYYLATHGRKGPVWIDIPLDIQGSIVDEKDLIHFDESKEPLYKKDEMKEHVISSFYDLLNGSERPVFLIGHGIVASKSQKLIREMSKKWKIPVLATWRAKGVFGDEEELFMGSPGIPATRFSNYVLQNADLLIVLGTRLNPAITAYDERHFAFNAKKIIVDIEEKEIDKLDIHFDLKCVSDVKDFLTSIIDHKEKFIKKNRKKWLDYCNYIKNKYPLEKEVQPKKTDNKVDGYKFASRLSFYSKPTDVFVGSSSGRTCGISHMAYRLKKGQRFVTSMGLGSMGWCIPSSIACAIAGKSRTLVLEGDGSLQHNIQELQLIRTYNLPIKVFVYSNNGYASIYTMQVNNFNSRFAGCNKESGLLFPEIKDIAKTYKLDYYCIKNDKEIDKVLEKIMVDDKACICEIIGSIDFDEIPKSMTIANKDGTFTSSKLENLYPFVSEQEQKDNMPEWK